MNARLKTSDLSSDFLEITRKSEDFGLRLKKRREKLGISQQEFARKVGVSTTTIQNYEGGQLPKGEHALSLSCVLKISLDSLFLGVEPTAQPVANAPEPPVNTPETTNCARCAKLEAKVDALEAERRELSTELRAVNAENRRLGNELIELTKEKVLNRERQRKEQASLLDEHQNIPSSESVENYLCR